MTIAIEHCIDAMRYRKLRDLARVTCRHLDMSGRSTQQASVILNMEIPNGIHGESDIFDYLVDNTKVRE